MNYSLTRILLIGIFMSLFGACAPPTPPPKSMVSDKELLAANLANQALEDYQTGRYLDSELRIRQILYLYPDSENAQFNLANAMLKLGVYEEAEALFSKLGKAHPEDPRYRVAQAKLYFEGGFYDKALNAYEEIVKFAQERSQVSLQSDALRSLSVINFLLGNVQKSLCYSSESIALRPLREDLIHHARLLIALNRIEEADLFLTDYFKDLQNQKDPYALHLYSMLCFSQGRFDDAAAYNQRAAVFKKSNQDLEFEIKLVNVLLYDLSEVVRKEYEDEDEDVRAEKEEERLKNRNDILLDKRLDSSATLYWPIGFLEKLKLTVDKREQEILEDEQNSGFFRSSANFIENLIPW